MNVQVTAAIARQMAERLQKSVTGLKRGTAYEALAHVFGHPNWDTLSGLLQKEQKLEAPPALPRVEPIRLYVDAYSTDEYGAGSRWACIEVNEKFLSELTGLQKTCLSLKLAHVAAEYEPEEWQDDAALNVRDTLLYVTARRFWLRGIPKHCTYGVESRSIDIEAFLDCITQDTQTANIQKRHGLMLYSAAGDIAGLLDSLVEEGAVSDDVFDN